MVQGSLEFSDDLFTIFAFVGEVDDRFRDYHRILRLQGAICSLLIYIGFGLRRFCGILLELTFDFQDRRGNNSTRVSVDATENLLQEGDFPVSGFHCRTEDESPSDQTLKGTDLPGFRSEGTPIYIQISVGLFSVNIGFESPVFPGDYLDVQECDSAIFFHLVRELDGWMVGI